MPAYNYNLANLPEQNGETRSTGGTRDRIPVRVVDVILSEDHPEYQDSNDIGAIKYRQLRKDIDEESKEELPTAWPIETTYRKYPVKNEIVYIENAPGPDHERGTKEYYSQVIGIWDNPHHNAFPDINIYDGELDLGENFIEDGRILPRTPKDGDILIEGRRGQSIRLTGNGNGLFFTNGQSPSGSNQITVSEHINADPSSLYMTVGSVPLSAASEDYSSYKSYIPDSPSTFRGSQAVLSSGRLVLNSKTDHILLSSNLTISFNALKGFNFDTPTNFVVGAGTVIRLGSKDADHPVLKGDDTVEVLTELFETLLKLTESLVQGASQPNTIMPTVIEQGSATTFVLANLKTRLEQLKSRKTFIE